MRGRPGPGESPRGCGPAGSPGERTRRSRMEFKGQVMVEDGVQRASDGGGWSLKGSDGGGAMCVNTGSY